MVQSRPDRLDGPMMGCRLGDVAGIGRAVAQARFVDLRAASVVLQHDNERESQKLCDNAGSATLISDTSSERQLSGLWRGSGGCRRNPGWSMGGMHHLRLNSPLVPSRFRPCATCGRWCWPLRVHIARCVQPERVAAQHDPDLLADRPADRRGAAPRRTEQCSRRGPAGPAGKPDPLLRRLPALVTEDRFGRAGSRQCSTALVVHTVQWDPRRPAPPLSWPELAATGRSGSR